MVLQTGTHRKKNLRLEERTTNTDKRDIFSKRMERRTCLKSRGRVGERYCKQSFEKDISRFVIYKIQNVWYSRNSSDDLRRKYLVFVGFYYVFT